MKIEKWISFNSNEYTDFLMGQFNKIVEKMKKLKNQTVIFYLKKTLTY